MKRESLEKLRITLLNEAKKKNNDKVIREILAKTFAYRRYEIVTEQPKIADFMNRWPTLFQENEVFFWHVKLMFDFTVIAMLSNENTLLFFIF